MTVALLLAQLVGSGATIRAAESLPHPGETRDFTIGEHDFLLGGKPFVIRCGEIHFPRVPRELWRQRLQMCRALGLNTVCVYLFWNFHEWKQGTYEWTGQADVAEFCRLAQAEGLWVLLRPGPYSCAEWEMGGLPWWLVQADHIGMRSRDPQFLAPAVRYLQEVGRVLAPLQVTRGGPLLMVQVENEYGSFGKDADYLGALRQALISGGFDVPLFACNPTGAIANGYRPDLFQVVNFGAGGTQKAFETLRRFQKTGPLMNGEYYPAWFDTWGHKHRTGAVKPVIDDLQRMLENRNSFSIYMAHGGTSFGLWAGADRPFNPDTSSYDYDAPISEAGWVTPKFTAIRELIAKHLQPGETLPPPPPANPVISIAPMTLAECAPLRSNLPAPQVDDVPRTMEAYGQSRGCILYRTILPAGPAAVLAVKEVHDFAWVLLDGQPAGVMDRRNKRYRVTLPARRAAVQLDILVEAMGRVNFGAEVYDRKGLHAPVQLLAAGGTASDLTGWQIFNLPLDEQQLAGLRYGAAPPSSQSGGQGPAFWRGTLTVTSPGDTFLDLSTWGKGVVWVNDHCLGRFWNIGPTQTMYLPGPWLKPGANRIVVLDLLGPEQPVIAGRERPISDVVRPELDFSRRTRASGTFTADSPPLASGSFTAASQWQEVVLPAGASGRYLCLEALSSQDGKPFAAVAELDALAPQGEALSKAGWKVLWVSSEETNAENGDADNVLDGQPSSHWHSAYGAGSAGTPGYPHRLVLDLGASQAIGMVRYLPRGGGAGDPGRIKDYRLYLSDRPFGLTPSP